MIDGTPARLLMFVWSSAVEPAVAGVLGEVDRRRDADRERDDPDDDPDLERADQGRQDAGVRGSSRRDAGQEVAVQPGQAADQDVEQQHDQGEEQDPDRHDAQARRRSCR